MNLLLADDELIAQRKLKQMLGEMSSCQVIATATNGAEVIEKAMQLPIDLVLMDIEMPVVNGVEAAYRISKQFNAPQIIFTTAHSRYMVQAFGRNTCGYLIKPIIRSQLQDNLIRVEQNNMLRERELLVRQNKKAYVCSRHGGKIDLISTTDVIFFQAVGKYTLVKHIHGEDIINESLVKLEKDFGEQFMRIHRSTLVNTQYIKGLKKIDGKLCVSMENMTCQLPVSRRCAPLVRSFLKRCSQKY